MNSTGCVSTDIYAASAVDKTADEESVLVLRIGSCGFWTIAGLVGCLLLSGWTGWHSSAKALAHPLDTINPNTDPKASLVRLPGIGPARAITIIEYRDGHSADGPAFRSPADLVAVAGLGPKTVEKMMPWISFGDAGQSAME
ncbi:MAG: helix-hairpin-helix domain-containing protein [Planctomycetes bacterium]|nr:helix-hairpin-helix domain-containing protein [Planctomycetota bacterium]